MFRKFFENVNLLDTVQQYLSKIEAAGFHLLAHQTADNIANKILANHEDFGGATGVEGTSLFTNSQQLRQLIETMQKAFAANVDDYYKYAVGNIHKGSNSVIVMAIPKKMGITKGINDLDNKLYDLMAAGKLSKPAIPNNYIIGYWQADGKFFANGRFKPQGVLEN